MKDLTSRTGISLAIAAATMSVVCASLVAFGYPWVSLAWVALAVAAAVSVAKSSPGSARSMGDVISDVEAEPARVPARSEPAGVPTRPIS